MKLTPKELERRRLLHLAGEHANDTEERNRETWNGWEGLGCVLAHMDASDDPKLLVKVAVDVVELPALEEGPIDLALCVVSNPNLVEDKRQRLLVKHRYAIKELAQASIIPMAVYEEVPRRDAKRNLRAISSVISELLGRYDQGNPKNVDRVQGVCRRIGELRYRRLSREEQYAEVVEGILVGDLVHPLALKPIHKTRSGPAQ